MSEGKRYFHELSSMTEGSKQLPDNSFGIVFCQSPFGYGHFINYEKKNGQVCFIDTQSNGCNSRNLNVPEAWDEYGIRMVDYYDCTNAKLSKNSAQYTNKIFKKM